MQKERKQMVKKLPPGWQDRIVGALDVLDKAAKIHKIERTHTADGKKLEIGLMVYHLDDPSQPWKITHMTGDGDEHRKPGLVDLKRRGLNDLVKKTTKLYSYQEKAVNASIRDINTQVKAIARDTKERLDRLDPQNRLDMLDKLKIQLKKKK